MNILDRYLARTIIGGTLMVLFVLVAISAFMKFVGEGNAIGRGEYTLGVATVHVLASTPQIAYEMFPMAVLLGTLLGLGQLASGNELTVIRASGISVFRLARTMAIGGLLLAVACAALGEYVAPQTERYANHLRSQAINQRLTVTARQGIWAKDGDTFVNVRQLKGPGELSGVFLYRFGADGRLAQATQASGAVHRRDGWQLTGVRDTVLMSDATRAESSARRPWESSIDPELLDLFVVEYDSQSGLALWRYAQYLKQNGLDSNQVQIYFWSRVVTPVNVLLMVVLALPFVFGPLRSKGAGQRVVVGMLVGIAFYAVTQSLLNSGTVYGLNPFWTNWLPTGILFLATTIGLARVP
jgi:lipopolysaccharide export system permease protein